MNTEIGRAFTGALLADASYVEGLVEGQTDTNLADSLVERLTQPLADYVAARFQVVTQFSDSGSGLSVTVWRERIEDTIYISFRGTEISIADFVADIDLAIGSGIASAQVVAMVNWYLRATASKGELIKQVGTDEGRFFSYEAVANATGALAAYRDAKMIVNGHSLGGHLTSAFARLFPGSVAISNTYNGAGFNPWAEPAFTALELALWGETGTFPGPAKQNNYFAEHGINFTTNDVWFEQYGERIAFFNEEGTGVPNHSIYKLTDSLALADLLGSLDENLSIEATSSVFNATSSRPEDSLEQSLDSLRRLLLMQTDATQVGDEGGSSKSRIEYHKKLQRLRNHVEANGEQAYTILPLIDSNAEDIRNASLKSDAKGEAYRYALRALNPYALVGADYGVHNTSQELNLYIREDREAGVLTVSWLSDRAELLQSQIRANIDDTRWHSTTWTAHAGTKVYFEDLSRAEPRRLYRGWDPRIVDVQLSDVINVRFGGMLREELNGGDHADRLYGDAGDDVLIGGRGDDYMEGGRGDDTYRYRFGDGHDTILDIDGVGQIFYTDHNGAHWLLAGGRQTDDVGLMFESTANRSIKYRKEADNKLIVFVDGAAILTIKDFRSDDLNISLDDRSGVLLAAADTPRPKDDWEAVIQGDEDSDVLNDQLKADPISEVIRGGAGDDVLIGASGQEGYVQNIQLYGGVGEDLFFGEFAYTPLYYEMGRDAFEADHGRLEPGAGARVFGEGGRDVLNGSLRDDLLDGGEGADTLYGFVGDDTQLGGSGNDWIDGNEGLDNIQGGDGDDRLHAGADGDYVKGGDGDDIIYGDTDTRNLLAWDGSSLTLPEGTIEDLAGRYAVLRDVAQAAAGNDLLEGEAGNDELYGGPGSDFLDGGADDDILHGEGGNDFLSGGDGADRLFGDSSTDAAGADATDYLRSGFYTYYWREREVGIAGDDWIDGGAGDDRVWGGAGSDHLLGGAGQDVLMGGLGDATPSGDDVLEGGAGDDALFGEDGADVLRGDAGNDHLAGGAGNDIYHFGVGGGHDAITEESGIDALRFGSGLAPDDVGLVAVGNDLVATVKATGESITMRNWYSSNAARVEAIQFEDGVRWDAFTIQRLTGRFAVLPEDIGGIPAGGSDLIAIPPALGDLTHRVSLPDAGAVDLIENRGDHFIVGVAYGADADVRHIELLLQLGPGGSPGAIRISGPSIDLTSRAYAQSHAGEYVRTAGSAPLYIDLADSDLTGLFAIDEVIHTGTNASDTLTPLNSGYSGWASVYYGRGGNDTIRGGAGPETLVGGAGADTMEGGRGYDTYVVDPAEADVIFDNGLGEAVVSNDVVRVPDGVALSSLTFSRAGDDLFINNVRVSRYFERDTSGAGYEEYAYKIERLQGDSWRIELPDHLSGLGLFGGIVGSAGNDTLIGDFFDNQIFGLEGEDTLVGQGGDDALYGQGGHDTLYGGSRDDRLEGGAGDDVLWGGAGNDILDGGDGRDTLQGEDGDDVLRAGGNEAGIGEQLIGGGGSDVLAGGNGDDTLIGDDAFAEGRSPDSNYFYNQRIVPGNDILHGGEGDDRLAGGSGGDIYRIGSDRGIDTIIEQGSNIFAAAGKIDEIEGEIAALDTYGGDTYNSWGWLMYFLGEWIGGPVPYGYPQEFVDAILALAGKEGPLPVAQARHALFTLRAYMIESQYDTVEFGEGLAPDDIVVELGTMPVTGAEFVAIQTSEDSGVAIEPPVTPEPTGDLGIEFFRFADGTVLTLKQIKALDQSPAHAGVQEGAEQGDVLLGTFYHDEISGHGDNDVLDGRGGADRLTGGAGADVLVGGRGGDMLFGDNGDDILAAGDSDSAVNDWYGGGGDDLYLVNRRDGDSTAALERIHEWETDGGVDTISFGAGTDPEELMARLIYDAPGDGSEYAWLEISSPSLGRTLIIDWHDDHGDGNVDQYHVERLQFLDGGDERVFDLPGLVQARAGELRVAADVDPESAPFIPLFRPQDLAAFDLSGTVPVAGGDHARVYAQTGVVPLVPIEEANQAPTVALPLADQVADEDAGFLFEIPVDSFSDPGDTLTYNASLSDGSALPSWLTFDPTFRAFSGLPGNDDVGTIDVRLTATDTAGLFVFEDFALVVNNVNDAPVVGNAIEAQDGLEDEPFFFRLPVDTFIDVDRGDELTYSATQSDGGALPAWLEFDAAQGTFSGSPGNSDVGSVTIRMAATDGSGAAVSTDFTVSVANVNDAPVVTVPFEDQIVTEDSPFGLALSNAFSDADLLHGDALSYSVVVDGSSLPDWLTIDPITGILGGVPGNSDVGELEIVVKASDASEVSASDVFKLTVENVNDAPMLSAPPADVSVDEYGSVEHQIPIDTFIDLDSIHGDRLTYAATLSDGSPLPAWLSFDGATRTFRGTPTVYERGDHEIRIRATDTNGASAAASFVLRVLAVGNAAVGDAGTDILSGTAANDVLAAGAGFDLLSGNGGNDVLDGGAGRDVLLGGSGDDLLLGGAGDDVLLAGSGRNRLEGGAGDDLLTGGGDNDTYVFRPGDGRDSVIALGNPRAGSDTVELGADPLAILFKESRGSLDVEFHGAGDRLSVTAWNVPANQIHTIVAQDGSTLASRQVEQLIQAMNQFSADNGGISWEQAIAERPQEVEAVLAAYWQPAAA